MATKVDNTASMLCRRHGCSSEKITERMLEAERRCDELEAALRKAIDNAKDDDPVVWGEVEDALKGQSLD